MQDWISGGKSQGCERIGFSGQLVDYTSSSCTVSLHQIQNDCEFIHIQGRDYITKCNLS